MPNKAEVSTAKPRVSTPKGNSISVSGPSFSSLHFDIVIVATKIVKKIAKKVEKVCLERTLLPNS
jgi:hypothetical protein